MSGRIVGLQDWLQTPQGRYVLDWETAQLDRVVSDIFGYHALQLGLPVVDTLRANRMPHRWRASDAPLQAEQVSGGTAAAGEGTTGVQAGQRGAEQPILAPTPAPDLLCDFSALPFAANSLDLVVLPHTLELHPDPHATLREVERVLMPEGRVVICGLNPASLWGMRQRRSQWLQRLGWGEPYLSQAGDPLGYWRLRDWLRLLSFEVESGRFGCYRPAVRSEAWLQRYQWMDRAGSRWWPIFGAVYFLVAVKRVRGMRMLGPVWRSAPSRAAAPVSIANRSRLVGAAPRRDMDETVLETQD